MREALATHDRLVRESLQACGGYEVKTIGDSFMVAFSRAVDAVRFGCVVQTALAEEGVMPAGLTRPNADDGFDMLMVRIGVHCGLVDAVRSPVTGRVDYFGPMVNMAARVEAHGAAGAVTVTPAVMAEIDVALGDLIAVKYAEARVGKGLQDPLWLTALLPRALETRTEHVQMLCGVPASPTAETVTSLERSSDGSNSSVMSGGISSISTVSSRSGDES